MFFQFLQHTRMFAVTLRKIIQTRMCLVPRNDKRVCVWCPKETNAYVFATRRGTNAYVWGMCVGCVCYIYVNKQTRMCLVSEQQTRMCLAVKASKQRTNAYVFVRCTTSASVFGTNHRNVQQKTHVCSYYPAQVFLSRCAVRDRPPPLPI